MENINKIIVLMAGVSVEKEISILTGESVFNNLNEYLLKNKNITINNKVFTTVEKYLLSEDIIAFVEYLKPIKDSVVIFNALHGKFGEDGRIQGLLDLMKIPYTHSGVLTSSISMNKVITKKIASYHQIDLAKDVVCDYKNYNLKAMLAKINQAGLDFPLIIKPVDEGSSVGVYLLKNEEDLSKIIPNLQKFKAIIIEEYLEGIECTVGVLNHKALVVMEIISDNSFFDYEAKYTKGIFKSKIPADLPEKDQLAMIKAAETLSKAINARGVIRIDFIYSKGKPYLLEINNQPGMTAFSTVPTQYKYLGNSYIDLCLMILQTATFDN
ncbi:D-alanine--D-alanine ligase [Candidatus Hepatincolaceae symbiont of Richtersius coronifer]